MPFWARTRNFRLVWHTKKMHANSCQSQLEVKQNTFITNKYMSNCSILLQDHLIAAGSSCFLFFFFFSTKMNPVVKWILMQSIGSRIGHIPDLKSLRCSWEILKARILLGDPLSKLFMDMILRDFLLIVPLLFLLLSFTVSKNETIELKALLNTKSLHTSVDQSSNVWWIVFKCQVLIPQKVKRLPRLCVAVRSHSF